MNLPFIVDVAIGLVLIYLVLSLLSSEIQEILATILQWRAAHLKKSIEILLMGDGSVQGDYLKLAKQGIFQTPAEIAQHTVGFLPDSDSSKSAIQDLIQTQLSSLKGTAEERTAKIVQELDAKGLVSGDGLTETGSTLSIKDELARRLQDALLVEELYRARSVTQRIYNDPLIQNISQNAREGFEGLIRGVTRSVITAGRRNKTLDRGNEPSYIPSETFATTLLDILNIPQFTRRLTALNLKILVQAQILDDIEEAVKNYQPAGRSPNLNRFIDTEFKKFNNKLAPVIKAFVDERISLEMAISLIRSELVEYITLAQTLSKRLAAFQEANPNQSKSGDTEAFNALVQSLKPGDREAFNGFVSQLISIRQLVFFEDPQGEYRSSNELIQQLQPSVAQVMKAFRSDLQDVNQKYRGFTDGGSFRSNPNFQSRYQEIIDLYDGIRRDAQQIAHTLPFPVRASLDVLAERAQINLAQAEKKVKRAQDDLHQFKTEIEKWFDRSMDRASGVYKRNAKGVGFLIGLTIALAINADTVHIAQRLASSTTLRQALVSSADNVTQTCPPPPIRTTPSPQTSPAASPAPVPAPVAPPVVEPAPPAPTSWLFFDQPANAQSATVGTTPSPSNPTLTAGGSLNCIQQEIENVTELPLGWGSENTFQQTTFKPIDSNNDRIPDDSNNDGIPDIDMNNDGIPDDSNDDDIPDTPPRWMPFWLQLKRVIGWTVSGLALSMGAAFWFESLSKLINVRNTGKRPDDRPTT